MQAGMIVHTPDKGMRIPRMLLSKSFDKLAEQGFYDNSSLAGIGTNEKNDVCEGRFSSTPGGRCIPQAHMKGIPPMKENGDRFVQAYMQQDGLANRTYVLVDRQTGVNYLLAGFLASSGVSCTGMTVLIDSSGKPIVTPVEE